MNLSLLGRKDSAVSAASERLTQRRWVWMQAGEKIVGTIQGLGTWLKQVDILPALKDWEDVNLFLNGFNGDVDAHFVAHMRRILASVEIRALDRGISISANSVLFQQRMWHGLE